MRTDATEVTNILEEIRLTVDATKEEFIPPIPIPRNNSDKDLRTLDEITSLFHSSGFLIDGGCPVFVYIPDHTTMGLYGIDDPSDRNKLHFTVCTTLIEMKRHGRFESRYRRTYNVDNRYNIEIKRKSRSSQPKRVRLYPCKHCLNNVGYHCYSSSASNEEKSKIVKNFDAKEALALLWQQFHVFKKHVADLTNANAPVGYTRDFERISRRFRADRNFTCEECSVNMSVYTQCLDTHHKDGNKRNNEYDNLQCLCKLCHADIHSHYSADMCAPIIKKLREEQGIS